MAIFGLWRSCRVPKYSQNDENVFANTLDFFWSRMKNFRPPRPGHPYFRPQKFLHIAIFSQKSPFLGCFRLKTGYLMSKTRKKIFFQNFLQVHSFRKKVPKCTMNSLLAPTRHILAFFEIFEIFENFEILKILKILKSYLWVLGALWGCQALFFKIFENFETFKTWLIPSWLFYDRV